VAGRTAGPKDYNCSLAARKGIPVYRRRSGGGAVVLGPGVLAIALIHPGWPTPRPPTRHGAEIIARAVRRLGLDAWVENEGDIAARAPDGEAYKVGGSAAYTTRRAAVYHATLIVDEPTRDMYTLTPPRTDKLEKGLATPVKYRPASLQEHWRVDRRSVIRALAEVLEEEGYGLEWALRLPARCPGLLERAARLAASRYGDPAWRPCLAP